MENLLREFYSVATRDEKIEHYFAELDLETHLPIIGIFWESGFFRQSACHSSNSAQKIAAQNEKIKIEIKIEIKRVLNLRILNCIFPRRRFKFTNLRGNPFGIFSEFVSHYFSDFRSDLDCRAGVEKKSAGSAG